jgi:glycosyltransferase involved in cell wall biosynthesis
MKRRKNNICFICEQLKMPIDEGMKRATVQLIEALKRKRNLAVLGRELDASFGRSYKVNKLYLDFRFLSDIRNLKPDIILYLPSASLTLASFIRTKIISASSGRPTAVMGLQRRKYNTLLLPVLFLLRPDLVVTQSRSSMNVYRHLNFRVTNLRAGVDLSRFCPVDPSLKRKLRIKYGLPVDEKIILHVGHLNRHRGIRDLLTIAGGFAKVVIVGSTSTIQDQILKKELINGGAIVIDTFIECIEEIYQASDLYAFPTQIETSAMEFPLSILEAMACGLPILTIRFGGLVDYFNADDSFCFYSEINEARRLVPSLLMKNDSGNGTDVNKKVIQFGWDQIADELLLDLDTL